MKNKYAENTGLLTAARLMIAVSAIGHLIFASIHVDALLLLENEICGFVMFLFVLLGLVALFESTRIKDGQLSGQIFTIIVCLAAAAAGGELISIYRHAIANQRALETPLVSKAVLFSGVLAGVYVISAVLLLAGLLRQRTRRQAV